MKIVPADEVANLQVIRDQFLEIASLVEELQLELRRLKNEVEVLQQLKKLEELKI